MLRFFKYTLSMILQHIKFILKLIYGRSLESVALTHTFNCLLIIFGLKYGWPAWLLLIGLIIIIVDIIYFIRLVYWILRVGRKQKVYGYLRWDNTLELHISKVHSTAVFMRKLKKTIRYAQKHGHYIEFTSGMIPYGRLIRQFGDSLVSVKSLGFLGRFFHGLLALGFVNGRYDVSHPLRVVINPRELRANRFLDKY